MILELIVTVYLIVGVLDASMFLIDDYYANGRRRPLAWVYALTLYWWLYGWIYLNELVDDLVEKFTQ